MARRVQLPDDDPNVFRLFSRAFYICSGVLIVTLVYKFSGFPAQNCYNVSLVGAPHLKSFLVVAAQILLLPPPTLPGIADGFCRVVDTFVDALIDGLIVVLILEFILRYRESQHVGNTIVRTLEEMFGGKNQLIFSCLSDKTKEAMIRGSLQDTLGEYGKVFYDQIVSAYLGREVSYRQGFEYHIFCCDEAPLSKPFDEYSAGERRFVELTRNDHVWLQQNLKFTRHGAFQNKALPHLVARFAFTQSQLTRFIASDELFFRELVRVADNAKQSLFSIPDSEIDGFVKSAFAFRAFTLGDKQPLTCSAYWMQEEGAGDRFLEISISNPSGCYEGSGCQIEFVLPHHRLETEFLVTLPQPVKPNVVISFTKSKTMKSLSYIPFISTFRDKTYVPTLTPEIEPETVSIEIIGWVFPTGGLVFVWKPDVALQQPVVNGDISSEPRTL